MSTTGTLYERGPSLSVTFGEVFTLTFASNLIAFISGECCMMKGNIRNQIHLIQIDSSTRTNQTLHFTSLALGDAHAPAPT